MGGDEGAIALVIYERILRRRKHAVAFEGDGGNDVSVGREDSEGHDSGREWKAEDEADNDAAVLVNAFYL